MPDGDGLVVLRTAKEQAPEAEVILLTAYAGWESAKEAMRRGAFDYFEKGKDPEELLHRIEQALAKSALRRENQDLRSQVRERFGLPGLIARSKEMHPVLELVRRVAPTAATILIQGESGTGKEVLAKAIHQASPHAERPFVAVNCGALPEPLLESEIFGHVKGAFTGATGSKMGLFEVRRVGATQVFTVDVRVLAATSRDLEAMVREQQFREDLFYRLNVIPIHLPPLRERREDIPALAEHFLQRFAKRQGRALQLSPEALERLLSYPWPGNVRELEYTLEPASILARHEMIGPEDLPPHIAAGTALGPAPALPQRRRLCLPRPLPRGEREARAVVKPQPGRVFRAPQAGCRRED